MDAGRHSSVARPAVTSDDLGLLESICTLTLGYVQRIDRKVNALMVDTTQIEADLAALGVSVDGARSTLDELSALVASLSVGQITQDQIDQLDASVNAARGALDAAVAADDPTPGA